MGLGDLLHAALDRVGITPDRVSSVLGDCRCDERREALNQWAKRVMNGKVHRAVEYLEELLR